MIVNSYEDIPGFCSNTHYNQLTKFMSSLPANSKVLEIGCGWGKSTWAILDGLPTSCSLDVCDTFTLESNRWFYFLKYQTRTGANENALKKMEESILYGQLYCFFTSLDYHSKRKILKEVYVKESLEILKNDNCWDAVYIDGKHNYLNVYTELTYLKDVPYLCGDDYNHSEVHPALEDFVNENCNRKLSFENDLWIIK